MIPRLVDMPGPVPLYAAFLAELRARGFEGDLSSTYSDRTVLATDNSIYQLTPQAIAFPRSTDDLVRIARAAHDPRFADVKLAPRGGGTGTNGQSLTDGLVVDVSRHMNRIIEIDVGNQRVRVQAGVVKDQLNAALVEHGLFFAPELSTSNRATIGGMINTDASGQGSYLYGKTRDHVLSLTTVLLDGTVWTSRPLDDEELAAAAARPDRVGSIHRLVDSIQRQNEALIAERFPKLNRCLTGYDLAHIRDRLGRFDLNAILCGAEGTLGFIAEAELNVLPIPKYSALVNIRYDSFDAALRDARTVMDVHAASVETVDSRVLALARNDIVWGEVSEFFPDDPEGPAEGVNLVEVLANDVSDLEDQIGRIADKLEWEGRSHGRRGFTVARNEEGEKRATPGCASRTALAFGAGAQDNVRLAEDGDEAEGDGPRLAPSASLKAVERIWGMRKKAVGLLGNMQGGRRPIPFVEDTAVPPEHLADYIAEFRAALDRRGLIYGMFGHVDAGVLHVRPAIDMTDPAQEPLIREISDEVVALTQKYGGVLWGEHGKGVRSEYAPTFFGPLYKCLQQIKAAFDPNNQLNPGKIAAPAESSLLRIDGVPTRGARDRAIPVAIREAYDNALHCNGNGACYNWDPDDAMCPSWKGIRERRHSPKGRAQLMREWLRQLTLQNVDPVAESRRLRATPGWRTLPARIRNTWARHRAEPDFSHEVKEALDGCLACKSCVGQCPIKVNVPAFRSKFFELYYGRYLRPMRDYVVASIEHLVPWMARTPSLANALAGGGLGYVTLQAIGLVQTPKLSGVNIDRELQKRGIGTATPKGLRALSEAERARSVVVVQDAFTSYYETALLLDLLDLIQTLGFRPWLAPYRPNGKALHVHGFLGTFERAAAANAAMLQEFAATGVELVGLDPSMTLTYRSEYPAALGANGLPAVSLVQEWLAQHREALPVIGGGTEYRLLPHCTERTTAPAALRDWPSVFSACGLRLTIVPSGCCGMAGTWGHEAEHRATSEHIYSLSWAAHVAAAGTSGTLLADGYSCRSQAKLIDNVKLPHPVQALLAAIRDVNNAQGRRESTPHRADTAALHHTGIASEAAQKG
jgi:FAD/FMN-containing dehydrogenase/Fe-S oxidoreductase